MLTLQAKKQEVGGAFPPPHTTKNQRVPLNKAFPMAVN